MNQQTFLSKNSKRNQFSAGGRAKRLSLLSKKKRKYKTRETPAHVKNKSLNGTQMVWRLGERWISQYFTHTLCLRLFLSTTKRKLVKCRKFFTNFPPFLKIFLRFFTVRYFAFLTFPSTFASKFKLSLGKIWSLGFTFLLSPTQSSRCELVTPARGKTYFAFELFSMHSLTDWRKRKFDRRFKVAIKRERQRKSLRIKISS